MVSLVFALFFAGIQHSSEVCKSKILEIFRSPELLRSLFGVNHIGPVVDRPSPHTIGAIHRFWKDRNLRLNSVLSRREFHLLQEGLQLSEAETLVALAQFVSGYSHPPLSEYPVGIAGRTMDGSVLFGVNLEIITTPLNTTVHG